jgi:pyruvate/2-oxoglutarate dehydrogenase complex dihydrolipoamide dehydrogenase (E3) component
VGDGEGEGQEGEGGVEGFVALHVAEGSDTILGCTIVGEGAGDMISEVTALMQSGQGMATLGAVIHPYPVKADAFRYLTLFFYIYMSICLYVYML